MNNDEKHLYLYTAHGNDLVRIGIQDDSGKGSFVEGPPLNAVASAYAILDSAAHAYAEGKLGRCPEWLGQAVRLLQHAQPEGRIVVGLQTGTGTKPCPHCKHPVAAGDPMGDGGYCSDWCLQTHRNGTPTRCPEWSVKGKSDIRCTLQTGHDGAHVFPLVDGGAE